MPECGTPTPEHWHVTRRLTWALTAVKAHLAWHTCDFKPDPAHLSCHVFFGKTAFSPIAAGVSRLMIACRAPASDPYMKETNRTHAVLSGDWGFRP